MVQFDLGATSVTAFTCVSAWHSSIHRLRVGLFGLAAGLLVLSGCASTGPSKSAEDEVRARAQSRWEAVIAGKWELAYSYTTPAYRKTVDLFGFRSRAVGPVRMLSVEVRSVTCQQASCDVKVRLGFVPVQRGFPETATDLEERWIEEGGEWWRYQEY